MLLGSHLSAAGGPHRALEAAAGYGFKAVALFVRSPRQWRAPALTGEAIRRFRDARARAGIEVVVAHANYLYNLAGQPAIRRRSMEALRDELQRCAALGIEYLVLHPGSCPNAEQGIRRIARGVNQILRSLRGQTVELLLEGTAGQGNSLGHRFEDLAAIFDRVDAPAPVGVCLDTCHLFAAGYELRSARGWKSTAREFDRIVGFKRLKALHCNDSRKGLGSRVDRHTHIGEGEIGRSGFAQVLNDRRMRNLPVILETPKGRRASDGRDWDEINVETIRSLLR
jgi:deoxyribonuclease-4